MVSCFDTFKLVGSLEFLRRYRTVLEIPEDRLMCYSKHIDMDKDKFYLAYADAKKLMTITGIESRFLVQDPESYKHILVYANGDDSFQIWGSKKTYA